MRLGLIPIQELMTKWLKVLAVTVRTLVEVRRRIWVMQPILYSNTHELSTIETDTRLHLDPLEAKAGEQFDLMAALEALSLKENTHQSAPRALPSTSFDRVTLSPSRSNDQPRSEPPAQV